MSDIPERKLYGTEPYPFIRAGRARHYLQKVVDLSVSGLREEGMLRRLPLTVAQRVLALGGAAEMGREAFYRPGVQLPERLVGDTGQEAILLYPHRFTHVLGVSIGQVDGSQRLSATLPLSEVSDRWPRGWELASSGLLLRGEWEPNAVEDRPYMVEPFKDMAAAALAAWGQSV